MVKAERPTEFSSSAQHLARIFFASFEHSQGLPELQRLIFQYIHSVNSQLRMTDQIRAKIFTMVSPRIEKYLEHTPDSPNITDNTSVYHPNITNKLRTYSKDIIITETVLRLNEMYVLLTFDPSRQLDTSIIGIVKGMISREFKFLHEQGGRVRKNIDPNTLKGDPWFSYLCHYALNEQKTRIPEFDQMYSDVKGFILSGGMSSLSRETDVEFDAVVSIYNREHPQTPVR